MTEPSSPATETEAERVEREATAWFVRLNAPAVASAERQRFREWLSRDPAHHEAFNAVKRLWADLDAPATVLGADGWHRRGLRRHRGPARFVAAGLVAACLLFMAAAAIWRDQGLIDRLRADEATIPGERREIALADGSRAYLDGDSAVRIRLDPASRQIELLRGRIWLDVVRDPDRPFLVGSGDVETRVLGTAFAVDRQSDRISVTVERGQVAVGDNLESVSLSAGQRVEFDGRRLKAPIAVEPETALAWRRGLIVLDRAPLSKVIDEMERMTPGRVIIRDQSLRDLRLSGVFRADDPEAVIEAVRGAFALRTLRLPGFATLIYR